MIPAAKNEVLAALVYAYFRRMARRAFHTIAGRGLEHLRELPPDRPVLLFCNHTNWWDGLILLLLTRQIPHKASYCMMEEKQLQHYRFFTWVGAFSVDLTHGSKAVASLRYAQKLLEKPEAAIWIFPQGKLCRADEPIAFKPGTDYLARKTPGAMLVPLALRYDFFREDRPNVLIEVGRPFAASELTEGRLEWECNEAFSRVSEAAQKQDLSGFSRVFAPRWTVNKRWEWVKRAMTGRLEGFKAEN